MLKPYSEVSFSIDLITDAYKLTDPFLIVEKVKEDLDIIVTISQVLDYIGRVDDYEQQHYTIKMNQIF